MPDEIATRLIRAEWDIEALKEGHRQQGDKMADLVARMDENHKETMAAIGSLRDDRAKSQGAAEARALDAESRQNRLKWLSFGLAVIGTLVALGWFGEAKAIMVTVDHSEAPIPVQYHTRQLP